MPGQTRKDSDAPKAVGDGPITLKLAHPMAPDKALRIGIETDKDLEVHQPVKVSVDDGRALIESGLVQVDPFDRAAVAEALKIPEEEVVVTAAAPAPSDQKSEKPAGSGSVQR